MKIICHMGLPKTGTTSLQHALHASRDRLREQGVYYPDGGVARENHKLLTALYKPDEGITPGIKYLFDGDEARMRLSSTKLWESIKSEVERKKPELLILSSEFFFIFTNREEFQSFYALLSQLSDDITPVLYVREAAALYGSICQQCVKNGRPLEPLDGTQIQNGVASIEAAFGTQVVLCNADRDRLLQGDILTDFLSRFVTPIAGEIPVAPRRLNESVSAEILAILDRFRRIRYPRPGRVMPDHFSLRTILAKLEAEAGRAAPPRLKPEFAEAVRRSSHDMLWMRQRYGIEFTGVDYNAIDGALPEIDPTQASIEELFDVDLVRRDALQAAAMAEALARWRGAGQVPRLTRALGAASSGLLARLRRSGA